MPGIGLLHADFTDHAYRPHVHTAMVVAVTDSGGAIITSRGLEAEARPNKLFLLTPGEVQSARMGHSQRWVYRAFYFSQNALEDICMSIAEAATAAGFYDQSALTNYFRRSYGITLGQYALAMRR